MTCSMADNRGREYGNEQLGENFMFVGVAQLRYQTQSTLSSTHEFRKVVERWTSRHRENGARVAFSRAMAKG